MLKLLSSWTHCLDKITRWSFHQNKDSFMTSKGFDPEIVAFCCHYCAYAAADLAGSMRLEYPTSVKVIELPCTGKLDVLYVLRAFENGADGVMVAG
jgi:phenylalanyl-tRNA synthetase beta subunit